MTQDPINPALLFLSSRGEEDPGAARLGQSTPVFLKSTGHEAPREPFLQTSCKLP